MPVARPKLFEPKICLYDKPVHPEFFRIVAEKTIRRKEYEVSLSITSAGHRICWIDERRILTEVISANITELPMSTVAVRSLFDPSRKLLTLPDQDFYRNSSRIETVPTDFFGAFEQEFARNLEPKGLIYRFGFSGRMTLGGISYIGVDSRARSLKIRTVHTFPDDAVLLKTESVFLLDRD